MKVESRSGGDQVRGGRHSPGEKGRGGVRWEVSDPGYLLEVELMDLLMGWMWM